MFYLHEIAGLLNKEIDVRRDVVLQRPDRGEVVVVGDVVRAGADQEQALGHDARGGLFSDDPCQLLPVLGEHVELLLHRQDGLKRDQGRECEPMR